MNRSDLRAALSNANVQAFYRTVREGESRQDDRAYFMRFGGLGQPPKYFDDLSRHPRIPEPTTGGKFSTAAGAPQATWTTWSEEQAKYGWTDFSREAQDEFFVARLVYRKALDAVREGRFEEACRLCRNEWTSLPGGDEENAATKRARETFLKWGGKVAAGSSTEYHENRIDSKAETVSNPVENPELSTTRSPPLFDPDSLSSEHYGDAIHKSTINPVPSADEQEAHMALPIIPLLTAFGPELVKLIPQFASMFGSGSTVQIRNAKAAEMAVSAVVEAVKAPNLQAAIETMQSDPQAAKAAQIAAAEVLALVEVGGGIVEARKASYDPGQVAWWMNPAVIVAIAVLPLVYMVVSAVVFGVGGQAWSDDVKTLTVTAILSGALGSITGFFLGSSLGSQRKTSMFGKE